MKIGSCREREQTMSEFWRHYHRPDWKPIVFPTPEEAQRMREEKRKALEEECRLACIKRDIRGLKEMAKRAEEHRRVTWADLELLKMDIEDDQTRPNAVVDAEDNVKMRAETYQEWKRRWQG